MKRVYQLLSIIIVMIVMSCSKDEPCDTSTFQYDAGIRPDTITCIGTPFFQSNDTTFNICEYDTSLKLVTTLDHEEYQYDQSCYLLSSGSEIEFHYNDDNQLYLCTTGFRNYEIVSTENKIREIIYQTEDEGVIKYSYSYQENSNNIDTVKVFLDMMLYQYSVYKYDDKNHPYKNLNIPYRCVEYPVINLPPDNNPVEITYYGPNDEFYRQEVYTLEYNENDFPSKILRHNALSIADIKTFIYSYTE